MLKKFPTTIFSLLLLSSCSSGDINIQSFPSEAEVSVTDSDGKIRSLGKTPLRLKGGDVFRSGYAFSELKVSKTDHESSTMLLSRSSMPSDVEVSLSLKRKFEDPKVAEANSRNEKIAQQIAQANNFINNKRLLEAEQLMTKFVQDYPHISVGYDYMGNINYLKKDLKRALYYYEKGLNLNPENIETRDMVTKLKGIAE